MARSNYYLGPRPEAWVRDVPNYEKLVCRGSLGAAELWFYGNQGRLEFDFMMARGWSGGALRLRIRGAERVDLDRAGDLLLKVPGGELRLLRPVVYQGSDRLPPSAARYRIEGPERIALTVSGHDRQKPLRIDPVLTYSTYLGGSGLDGAAAVVTDATGNAYVVGWTSSLNFPVGGGPQPTPGGLMDAFITKLDPTGTTRLYSTYLGGFGNDYALAATLDPAGNLWVAGGTASANFPTASPLQSYAGSTDAFVAKLNPSGTLLFSTYLGGSGFDEAHGIAADASGAYVVGVTQSENFPVTSGAFQTSRRGPADAFVAKYHINASSRIYSTYLGGSASDEANAVGVDAAGNAWIGGTTWSGDFPLAAPLRGHAGASDGFVSKLNATGGALLFSSLLGGTGIDQIFGLGLDPTGNAYVTGSTGSFDFPTTPEPSRPREWAASRTRTRLWRSSPQTAVRWSIQPIWAEARMTAVWPWWPIPSEALTSRARPIPRTFRSTITFATMAGRPMCSSRSSARRVRRRLFRRFWGATATRSAAALRSVRVRGFMSPG
jgi:hypothetical protein